MSLELWQDPQVPLQFQFETSLLLRWDGYSAFPSRRRRGIDPHFELRRGKSGTSCVVVGNSAFLSSGDSYLGKLLGFHKGCQIPFLLPRRNIGFLGKHCSVKGPHLMWRGKFLGFCGFVVGNVRLLSSCVGTWGTLSCFLREVRSAFELRGAPRDSSCIAARMNRASSRVEVRTSWFLSISDIDLRFLWNLNRGGRPHLVLRLGTRLPSRVVNRMSGLLSSCIWNLWLFLEDATRVSVPLGVAIQYLGFHSNQTLSRVNGEVGVFRIVTRPTRFPVEFQCETDLLSCDVNVGIAFHTKQENQPSSRDEES